MNKKLLLGAALLVGMGTTFTSCVDSTESASVTAIRDAKAEQLKSIAELNKALAEKELIIANAEKAAQAANQAYQEAQAELLAAQAEYEKAQADYLKAQAAYLNAQSENEKARLELELKKAQAELDLLAQQLEQAKADLAAQQARLQAELARLEAQLELLKISVKEAQFAYDQMVKAAQKAESDAEKAELLAQAVKVKDLINKYNFAANQLVEAKVALADAQMQVSRLEAGLENEKNVLSDAIIGLQNRNDQIQKTITYYYGVYNTYKQWMGEIVTFDMVEDSYLEAVKAQVALNDFVPQVNDAEKAYTEARDAVFMSEYYANVQELLNNASGYYRVNDETKERTELYNFNIEFISPSQTTVPAECRGKYSLSVGHWQYGIKEDYEDTKYDAIYTYAPVFEDLTYGNEELENGDYYQTIATNYNLINDGKGLNAWLDCKLAQLKNQIENNGVEFCKEELDQANKYLTAAKAKLPKAKEEYTKAANATKTAETELKTAEAAYTAAQDEAEAKRLAYIAAYEAYQEIAEPTEEDDAKLEAALTALNDARDVVTEAYKEVEKADQKLTDAANAESEAEYAKYLAIRSVDYGELWVDAATKDLSAAEAGDLDVANQKELWTNTVKTIIAEAANNEANIKAYNDEAKTYAEKSAEYMDFYYAYTEAVANFRTLDDIYYYGTGILGGNVNANNQVIYASQVISICENEIAQNEALIEQYKADLAKLDTTDAELWGQNYDEMYRHAQAQVEKAQNNLAAAQQLYDIAKAELEAATSQK